MTLIGSGIGKFAFIVFFMVYSTYFLMRKKAAGDIEDDYMIKRYGGLFTYLRALDMSPTAPLYWPLVFMLQRVLLAVQLTFGRLLYGENYTWMLFFSLIYSCIGYLSFVLSTRAFHDPQLQQLEVFNQYSMLIIVYLLMASTTDLTESQEQKAKNSEALANFIYAIIVLNLLVCIYTQIKMACASLSRKIFVYQRQRAFEEAKEE